MYDTVDPADPHAYRRRPEWLSWWRSDWNPLTWDADEWFKTHDHAPWVEHTLALIEEGWGGLNYEPKLQDVEPPVRVRAPASPPPLTDWEVYSKQRVDARMAAQDAATLELWGSVGRWSSRHHPTGTRDVRVLNRLSDVPNYRRKVEWSEDEITALIALPEGAEKALHVHDPRFPRSVRGLRPVFPDSVEHLRGLRRPDGGPRLVDDVSPLMVATGSGWLAREFGVEGRVQLRSPRLDGFAPPGGDGEGTAGAGAVGDALLARGVADATDEDLAAVQTIEGDDDL